MDSALAAAYEAWELCETLPSRRKRLWGTGYDVVLHGEEINNGKKKEEVSGTNGDTKAPRGVGSGSRSHHEYMVEPEFEPKLSCSSLPQPLFQEVSLLEGLRTDEGKVPSLCVIDEPKDRRRAMAISEMNSPLGCEHPVLILCPWTSGG